MFRYVRIEVTRMLSAEPCYVRDQVNVPVSRQAYAYKHVTIANL